VIDEDDRKDIIREHSRRLSAGDLDGLLDLYAEDAWIEDPVGSGRRSGRDAVRAHWAGLVEAGTTEVAGEPSAGQDGRSVLLPVSAAGDFAPVGPEWLERGWIPAAGDRLHREYVLLLEVGEDRRIAAAQAFWSAADTGVDGPPPPAEGGPAERTLEYARRMNAGDVERVLDMFTDDVVFEDPVGSPPLVGKDDLRTRITWSIGCKVHEVPGRAVTSVDGRFLVVPSTVEVHVPNKVTFGIVGVMEVAEDGRTKHVRAYWGISDTRIGDGPQLTGVAHALNVRSYFAAMLTVPDGSASPA
jgi:ketosteroid isomerase-like protein